MKHTKKVLSFVLALVLALAMAMPVMAANGKGSITIKSDKAGHTYEAYQIFAGTLSADGKILSDIEWGNGVKAESVKEMDAQTKAKELDKKSKDADKAKAFAEEMYKIKAEKATGSTDKMENGKYVISDLPIGYYLVIDKDNSLNGADAYTYIILAVVGDAEVTPKSDVPSAEKKVKENTKYEQDEGYGSGYNDVADYNIGDTVPFAIYSKVPNMEYYKTYTYIFHDKMNPGLNFNPDSVEVTIDGKPVSKGFTVKTEEVGDDCTFEIVFDDLKTVPGAVTGVDIRINFTATLNSSAVIGRPGNVNDMYLEFSNNPNGTGTGTTPHDKVVVFTYSLNVEKQDGETKAALQGVKFKIYRKTGEPETIEYAKVENGKLTGWTTTEAEGTELESDAQGNFSIAGLDAGTYYLKETKPLDGYNALKDDLIITVTAGTANGQTGTGSGNELTELKATVTEGDNSEEWAGVVEENDESGKISGTIYGTISNFSGTQLPSTGGMGTTIFYVIGGILVIGAAILLISKRRAGSDK